MSGSKKKRVGSSSLADEMKNSLKFEEDDERRSNSGKSASVCGRNVSYDGALPVKGNGYKEALSFCDKAIASCPGNGKLHCKRAGALIGLKRIREAIKEFEEAIRLAPTYVQAREHLGSLLLWSGQVENARKHLFFQGHKPDEATLQKLQAVEEHINKCTDARKFEVWPTMLKEAEAATTSGAEGSSQLFACQAEAHLKLHQLEEAKSSIYKAEMFDPSATSYKSKLFGILSEAYVYFVQAQIHRTRGRFDKACTAIERAAQVDPQNAEVIALLKTMKLVGQARTRGNNLYNCGKHAEACSAYDEGLTLDSSNPILYCNRAACWVKLGLWEKSLADSNNALIIQPDYTKALSRRAISNLMLERWNDAVIDYEILGQEHPNDKDIAEYLSHAQIEVRMSRGENVDNMKVDGTVELVFDLEKFQAVITSSDTSVVLFKETANLECRKMSSVVDALSTKYNSVRFLKVDVELSPAIAASEDITTVPTVTIHKKGSCMTQLAGSRTEVLDSLIKNAIFAPN